MLRDAQFERNVRLALNQPRIEEIDHEKVIRITEELRLAFASDRAGRMRPVDTLAVKHGNVGSQTLSM